MSELTKAVAVACSIAVIGCKRTEPTTSRGARTISLSSIGGSARDRKAIGVPQPAVVGSVIAERGGVGAGATGWVVWDTIDLLPGGTATGIAGAEFTGSVIHDRDFTASGSFTATICEDRPPPLNACPRL